jgi:small subunit ribosomal protein S4e
MANKGSSGHIKRLNAPKYFAIHRKEHKYVVKQNPGRHTLSKSVALALIIRKLNFGSTRFESDKIIKGGSTSVNGKVIKEPKYPVGLNDSVMIGNDAYIIGINKNGQIEISKKEKSNNQIYKIVGKYKEKGNKIMLRLHDGRTISALDNADVNDSVIVADGNISKVLKLDSGSRCEVIDGVHVGTLGTIREISKGGIHKQKSVMIEESEGEKFETLVKNIIIVE